MVTVNQKEFILGISLQNILHLIQYCLITHCAKLH